MQHIDKLGAFGFARFAANIQPAACLLALLVPSLAFATPKEVELASPSQAMAYCQSGKMPSADIAYIAGAGGLAQYGPGANCLQQVPTKPVKLAIETVGKKTKECTMIGAKAALALCNNDGVGTYDIDYIKGPVGQTLSGPGYGCIVNFSSVSLGNAICK